MLSTESVRQLKRDSATRTGGGGLR